MATRTNNTHLARRLCVSSMRNHVVVTLSLREIFLIRVRWPYLQTRQEREHVCLKASSAGMRLFLRRGGGVLSHVNHTHTTQCCLVCCTLSLTFFYRVFLIHQALHFDFHKPRMPEYPRYMNQRWAFSFSISLARCTPHMAGHGVARSKGLQ